MTVADLKSVEDLAQSLDRLALPAQAAAILDNRWLQHLLAVSSDSKRTDSAPSRAGRAAAQRRAGMYVCVCVCVGGWGRGERRSCQVSAPLNRPRPFNGGVR